MNIVQKLLLSGLMLFASCFALAMERTFELTAEQTETFISIPPELYNCWVTVKNMLQDSEDIPENERIESVRLDHMTSAQYTIIKRYMDRILEKYSAFQEPGKKQEAAQQFLQQSLQQDLLNKTLSIDELIGFINANDFNDCSFMINAGIHALAAHIIQENPDIQACVNDQKTLAEIYPFLLQLTDTLLPQLATALAQSSEPFGWLYAQQKPQLQHTFTEVDFYPTCMALSHDGTALAVGEESMGRVKIWDIQTGNCTHTFETQAKLLANIPWGQWAWTSESTYVDDNSGPDCTIQAIAWSPNNQFLAYSNDTGVLSIWDMRKQKCINLRNEKQSEHALTNHYTSLVWSANSAYLITANQDSTITIWDFRDLNTINDISIDIEDANRYEAFHTPGGSDGWPHTALTLNISKDILATLNRERATIRLINTSDITQLKPMTTTEIDLRKYTHANIQHRINAIQWSPDGNMLAAAPNNGIIIISNINSAGEYTLMHCAASEVFMNIPLTTSTDIQTLSWAPDSKHIVVCAEDGTVAIWDVIKRSCIHTLTQEVSKNAQWSPHGTHIAIYEDRRRPMAQNNPQITLWSLEPQWKEAFLRDMSVEKAYLIMGAYWAYQHSTQLQIPRGSFLRDAYEGLPQEIQALLDPYIVHIQEEPLAKRAKIESPTHP